MRNVIDRGLLSLLILLFVALDVTAQTQPPLQPFAQHVRRIEDALHYLGQSLPVEVHNGINAAVAMTDEAAAVRKLQALLDPYVLAVVNVNPDSRVKVSPGAAQPELVEQGTRLFLVKVENQAGVTVPLEAESPNSGPNSLRSQGEAEPKMELTIEEVKELWADISVFHDAPMAPRLLGLGIEYQILLVYSRDAGERSAKIAFSVGQGAPDADFRNDIVVKFDSKPARPITFQVRNENGERSMASFLIKDRQGRIYPNPSKRLEPDFPFQEQIYRYDGEKVNLPDEYYTIEYSGGPEFLIRTKEMPVSESGPKQLSFQLQRWIDPSKYGYWSGDHHVHASGCAHYKNPTEGVQPEAMMRQVLGENLNIAAVLTWGPSWYYQKQFFSSQDNELSERERIMHYDVEVSGFPSSHAGHLVLLGLKEDDYPGTTRIDEWPSWDQPVLQWAKKQGAVTGFTHSGSGLQVRTSDLPNYEMPGFDGIGANEYIVNVTHPDTVDIISAVDTGAIWELNIWYHTLNSGFRARIGGETDFPCIYDDKVGMGRSYVKLDELNYRDWIDGLRDGRSYVSDGKSHLIDFTVNGVEIGEQESELKIAKGGKAVVTAKVAAMLDPYPDPKFHNVGLGRRPYWDVEKARIPGTREVPVELIVNGQPVATKNILADGQVREISFETTIDISSWVALRILPSSHTNPIFAIVDGNPIRASRRSAEWCLAAVNQCWTQKSPRIRESEREEARQAYDHAREVYKKRMAESVR